MVVRDGMVALQQFSPNNVPKTVEIDGVQYTSSLRNNVLMVWMPQEHAEKLLGSAQNITKSCNCANGATKPLFFPASEINASLHETGHLP
jgi:hypothetical protein